MKLSRWLLTGALLAPVMLSSGCGGSNNDTTYLPVAPPTPEEREAAKAYTEQMLKRPGT